MKTAFLLIILIIVYGCTNVEPNNDPNPNYNSEFGQITIDTLTAVSDSVLREGYGETGFSTKLSLAEWGGLSSAVLVKFLDFPADSIVLDSVSISFTTINSFGNNPGERVDVNVYVPLENWDSFADTLNVWRNPPLGQLVTKASLILADSATSYIKMPISLINTWRDLISAGEDSSIFGLYIELAESEKNVVLELGSLNSSRVPELLVYSHTDTSNSVDTLNAAADISIYNYDEQAGTALFMDENSLFISSGVISSLLVKFDLSVLPQTAILYSANIILTETEENDFENPQNNSSFIIRPLEDLSTMTFNPNRTLSLSKDENLAKISGISQTTFAEDILQEIINGNATNEWFYIQFTSVDDELSVKRFYNNKSTEFGPKLIVKYFNVQK